MPDAQKSTHELTKNIINSVSRVTAQSCSSFHRHSFLLMRRFLYSLIFGVLPLPVLDIVSESINPSHCCRGWGNGAHSPRISQVLKIWNFKMLIFWGVFLKLFFYRNKVYKKELIYFIEIKLAILSLKNYLNDRKISYMKDYTKILDIQCRRLNLGKETQQLRSMKEKGSSAFQNQLRTRGEKVLGQEKHS